MILIRKMLEKDVAAVSRINCTCYKWLAEKDNYTKEQLAYLLSERG